MIIHPVAEPIQDGGGVRELCDVEREELVEPERLARRGRGAEQRISEGQTGGGEGSAVLDAREYEACSSGWVHSAEDHRAVVLHRDDEPGTPGSPPAREIGAGAAP